MLLRLHGYRPLVFVGLLLAFSVAHADLRVTGSSTILPVVKRATVEFSLMTGIRVHVSGGGSGHGVKSVGNGSAHIGMVSRALHPDEARHLVATPIGLDGVAVFVHERNAIQELKRDQVAGIYSGRIGHWRDLGPGTIDGRVERVGKLHGRSTRELFDGFFGLSGREYPPGTHLIGANVAGILYVSIDPMAVGYVSAGSLTHAIRQGAPIRPLPIDGVEPTERNMVNGRYPYVRPLNLVTRGAPQGEARRFIDWMKGEAGQHAVRVDGFQPVANR